MRDLALEIINLTNSKSRIIQLALPSDDPVNRIPNISRAISRIDWHPVISRKVGLQRTIDYFSRELNIAI